MELDGFKYQGSKKCCRVEWVETSVRGQRESNMSEREGLKMEVS